MSDQHERPKRFSDDELVQFHEDFQLLAERFETHEKNEQDKYDQLLNMQALNADAINQLTEATRDMVSAWKAAEGAVKVANAIGRVAVWVASLGGLGALLTWFSSHGGK